MTKGRGRAAFERGSITIHSVSALAIERVEIRKGKDKPVELCISMSNSAGIYQVQEILAPKVRAGPLSGYVEVIAVTDACAGEYEHRIVGGIRMEGAKFVPFVRTQKKFTGKFSRKTTRSRPGNFLIFLFPHRSSQTEYCCLLRGITKILM